MIRITSGGGVPPKNEREKTGRCTASETKRKEYFRDKGVNDNNYQRKE